MKQRIGFIYRLSIALLVVCIAIQGVGQYVVLGLFEMKKSYIANNLCEYRKNPKNTCKGKCYLRKQMRKTDCDKNPCGSAPAKKANISIATYMLPVASPAIVYHTHYTIAVQIPVVHHLHTRLCADSVFQPPRGIVA